MALSGTFYGTTNNQYVQSKIVWTGTQSVSGNYTDVTATLYYSRTNSGYTTHGNWSGTITINGSGKSESKSLSITYNSNTVAISNTVRVYHNSDGTKSFSISASGGMPGTSFTSTSISGTYTLDTIPRSTTPVIGAVTIGTAITISLPRASSSFTHNVQYTFGNVTAWIATGAGTSATWTPSMSLCDQIPNSSKGVGTISCWTYNGSTLIGATVINFTASVPSSLIPTINSVTISEAVEGLAAKFAAFVQGKSKLNVQIFASGAHGSTITKYQTYIESVLYTNASFNSNTVVGSGTINVVTTVTDSRGRTKQVTNPVTVVAYSPPRISSMSAWRIDTSGNASDDGTRIAMAMNFAISSVGGRNDRTYNFKYRHSTDSEFTSFGSGTASVTYNDTQYFTSVPEISTDYAYVIRLEIADYFETVAIEKQISTAFTIMDFRNTGKGMAIGKVSEKDALEVAMDTEFKGQVNIYAPSSTEADSGYLRFRRSDGTLGAFLSTAENGLGLNLHMYEDGAWSGLVKVAKDGGMTFPKLNGLRIKAGTKTFQTTVAPSAAVFTSAQLNTIFGTSGVTYDGSNSVCFFSNGNWSAQNKNIVTMMHNGAWYMRTADGSNFLSGWYQVNYLAITWA